MPFHRLGSVLTDASYFAVRDFLETAGHVTRPQVFRRLIKIGLSKFDVGKERRHAATFSLPAGSHYKQITLLLPIEHVDRIRDLSRKGFSVNWLVNHFIEVGLEELKGGSSGGSAEPVRSNRRAAGSSRS